MKLVMYGPSFVGKTAFMAKGYGLMNKGLNSWLGPDIVLKGSPVLKDMYRDMERGRYPDMTSQLGTYELHLKRGLRNVMDFTWVDIRGGSIHERGTFERARVESELFNADALMLFLSSPDLAAAGPSEALDIARDIAELLETAERFARGKSYFKIYMVLTKADLIDASDKERIDVILSAALAGTEELDGYLFYVTCERSGIAHSPDVVMYAVLLDGLYRLIENGYDKRKVVKTADRLSDWIAEETGDYAWRVEFTERTGRV